MLLRFARCMVDGKPAVLLMGNQLLMGSRPRAESRHADATDQKRSDEFLVEHVAGKRSERERRSDSVRQITLDAAFEAILTFAELSSFGLNPTN